MRKYANENFEISSNLYSKKFMFSGEDDLEFVCVKWETKTNKFVGIKSVVVDEITPENIKEKFQINPDAQTFISLYNPREFLEDMGVNIKIKYEDGFIFNYDIEFTLKKDYYVFLWHEQYVFRAGHYKFILTHKREDWSGWFND